MSTISTYSRSCLNIWVYGKLLGGRAGSAEPVPSMRVS